MFTKKKSFYQKPPLYIIAVVIIFLGIFINQITSKTNYEKPQDDAGNTKISAKNSVQVPGNSYEKANFGKSDGRAFDNADRPVNQGDIVEQDKFSYYLVKEIDGIIKIFYYDAEGEETVLKNTNISFSLISETDQNMFSNGVVVKSEDELQNLLQDFES